MKSVKKIFSVAVLSALLVTACSSTDKTPSMNVNYAPSWEYARLSENTIAVDKEWWKSFSSQHLNQLIITANKKNPDVLIAAERVTQAELQMKIANSSLFPSLSANASTGERKSKEENESWSGSDSSSIGISASYEIDLWGGIAASRHSARQSYKATVFSTEASRLSISAGIATAWFEYLALNEFITTAQKNIEIAERIQKIVDSLYRNGAATAADVAQQKTNLLSRQAALLPLTLQLNQTRAAIAILQGEAPQGYQLPREDFATISIPEINAGVPADVITRRPDVASVEAQLHAASADVHVARAQLLPGLQLSGSIGKSGSQLFSLNPAVQSTAWSLTAAQTLFAGGRISNQVKLSKSRQVEMLEEYRKTILNALLEVDDALNRVAVAQQQEINQNEIVVQSERSLRLVEARYRAGDGDLLSLLDSQRTLFQSRDSLVQQRLNRIQSAVDLYKALGGGWRVD